MRSTKIVTSFIVDDSHDKDNKKLLILKRSNKVKTMKGLWAGVSGIIEKDEEPLQRAKIEIFEELGIKEEYIMLIKEGKEIRVNSPQYANHEWEIFPFLFEIKNNTEITLNWENSEFKWIRLEEMKDHQTVPSLQKVLLNLL